MAQLNSPNGSTSMARRQSGNGHFDGSSEALRDEAPSGFDGAAADEEVRPVARRPCEPREASGQNSESGDVGRGSGLIAEGDRAAFDQTSSRNAKTEANQGSRHSANLEKAVEHSNDKQAEPPLEAANQQSTSERRSPRLLSPSAQEEEADQGRKGRKEVGQPPVGLQVAPPRKPPTTGKKAANAARKKVVEVPRGRKRNFSDLSDLSDLSDAARHESSDEHGGTSSEDGLPHEKGRMAKEQEQDDSRRSKRRKKGSSDVEAGEATDYDNEFASLPEKKDQPPTKKRFGKAHNKPRPTTGKTRKANAKSAPTSRSEKPISRTGARDAAPKSHDNVPDKPEKKGTTTMPETTITRTTRSRAKKQVVAETAIESPESTRCALEESTRYLAHG